MYDESVEFFVFIVLLYKLCIVLYIVSSLLVYCNHETYKHKMNTD